MALPLNCVNQVSAGVLYTSISASVGSLLAYTVTAIHSASGWLTALDPVHAGTFGAVGFLVNMLVQPIIKSVFLQPHHNCEAEVVGYLLNCILVSGVSVALCGAFGFPVAYGTTVALIVGQLALKALVDLCKGC